MHNLPPRQGSTQLSRLDEEFVALMTDIEKGYAGFTKHERIRIEQWCKKLCQVSVNDIWKQNRNLYALLLLGSITEGALQEPFNKMPPEDYLPSLNKQIVKGKLDAMQNKLQQSGVLIQDNYQSPSRSKKHVRAPSVGNQNLKVETRTLRNFSMSQAENSKQLQNSSISNLQNNFVLLQQSPEVHNRESFRQQSQRKYLSPHSKYAGEQEPNVQSHRDKAEIRDIRIIQNQLEIAQSTIETLKEELHTRFMSISQLNKDLERMSFSLNQFEKEKMLFESFLTKVSLLIKDGSIMFADGETSNNFLLKVNELCEILSLPRLKLRSTQAFTLDSLPGQEKMSLSSPKNENRLLSTKKFTPNHQGGDMREYYAELETKKKSPKRVTYSDKKNLRQTRSREGLRKGESNSMIKTISHHYNQNSDYINVFQPENTKPKFR